MHCVDFAVISVRCFFLKRLLYYFRASITSKEMRGDIGGFGAAANSAGSWQFYGGYSHAFEFSGLKFASLVGYRALGLDYSMRLWDGKENGINAIIHRPITGVSVQF